MSSVPELLDLAESIISDGTDLATAKRLARAIKMTLTGGDGETFALYHARVVDERNKLREHATWLAKRHLERTDVNGDWACRECRPHSDCLKDGFQCAAHAVLGMNKP